MGIKVSVISGDNAKTVKAIARHLKIDKIFAEVLPKVSPPQRLPTVFSRLHHPIEVHLDRGEG